MFCPQDDLTFHHLMALHRYKCQHFLGIIRCVGISQSVTWLCHYPLSTSSIRDATKVLPTLTLYTKEECSLCDDAKEILKKYKSQFVLDEVYIDKPENKRAFARYRYDIPVFDFNGEYLMKHRVNEELLKEKLREYNSEPT